jgi:hypothetical protein
LGPEGRGRPVRRCRFDASHFLTTFVSLGAAIAQPAAAYRSPGRKLPGPSGTLRSPSLDTRPLAT